MDSVAVNAMSVTPPTDVYERATVTTSEGLKLPVGFEGAFLSVQAVTSAICIRLDVAASAPTATLTATSTLSSDEPAAATNGSWRIEAGETAHFDLRNLTKTNPAHRIWLAHISADTNGRLKFYRSSGRAA